MASTPAPFAWPGLAVPVVPVTLTAGTAAAVVVVVVTARVEVMTVVVVVVLSSTGMTTRVSLVVVEVARVVGPRTVVKEREIGMEKLGRRWEEEGVTVDSGMGLTMLGSMVRVRTAVPIVAVRVTRLVGGGVVVEVGEVEVEGVVVVVVRGGSTVA